MKIQDLFEQKLAKYEFRPIPLKTPFKKANKQKLIGQGVEADVFASSAPNTVVKIISRFNDSLGYLPFLKAIIKHQDNPFFPKIHKIRIYTDPGPHHQQTLVVKMEKLIPLQHERIADLGPSLFKQIGVDPDKVDALNPYSNFRLLLTNKRYRDEIAALAKNPKFEEAMYVLSPLFNRYGSDLHAENWMVRLTGSGPQLVITDPFYGVDYNEN